jgi:hypothetical protein
MLKEIYKKFATPPADALKSIGAGRLKGMTDINPQWRIECLTEMFGLCGFGWYTKILNKEIIDGADGEKMASVDIELYVKENDSWSMPIQANGGSMFVANEKNGLHTSDEAFKMAYTDALSVACKMLGIGSAIYRGTFNTKYQAQQDQVDYSKLSKEEWNKMITEAKSVKQLNFYYHHWKDREFAAELQKASSNRKLQLENPDLKVG